MKRTFLCRLTNGAAVVLTMKDANTIIKNKGMAPNGNVQAFHTQNVLRRIKKYMPFVTGVLYKLTQLQTNIMRPEIITDAPQAKYLFYGKKMVDPKTNAAGFMTPEGWRSRRGVPKVLTNIDLKYNQKKNPAAGPRWDRTLSAAEGAAMAKDLERYIQRISQQGGSK